MTKGFTLVETLLTIAILAIFFAGVTAITFGIVQSYQKLNTVDEVQYNARFASEKLIRSVRNSSQIDLIGTTFDSNPGLLSLAYDEPDLNPTLLYVQNNNLYIKRGDAPEVQITTDRVDIKNFVLTDRTPEQERGSIIVSLTIAHKNPENARMFNYEETMEFAVTSRR